MRKAELKDLDKIMQIISGAKLSLKEDGIDQWQNGTPSKDMVKSDIELRQGYVFEEDGEVLAYSFLKEEEENDYLIAKDKFKYDNYFTIHRYCVDSKNRQKKIATRFFEQIKSFAKQRKFDSIRIDTHLDNKKMRGFIEKSGFEEVAIVYVNDNGIKKERIAYELKL